MTSLYSVAEIVAATGGQAEGIGDGDIAAISIDSRDIAAGALFVAIKGDRFDGHDFVDAALANGAVAALVSREQAPHFAGKPVIAVGDTLRGLEDIGRFARARTGAKIVAVTGSVGKTSTKDALRTVLAAQGRTHAALRSFNNHWGVPLTLARMHKDTAYGVFEVGMSAAGEITPLTRMVRPHVAVITAIAPAHLQNFGSLEGIARAKAEIFLGLEPGGVAIVNADHSCLDVLLEAAEEAGVEKIVTYGYSERANVRIGPVDTNEDGSTARVWIGDEDVALRIASSGRHRIANAVAALCVAREVGCDLGKAVETLAEVRESEGRGAVIRLGPEDGYLSLIDESYNANPASMLAALDVFANTRAHGGKKIVVLGDMLELGPESRRLHAGLKDAVLNAGADEIYLVGHDMAALNDALAGHAEPVYVESVAALEDLVLSGLGYGDAVMIKGSNSMNLQGLVSRIRERFDAAQVPGKP